jgi:hypothetical protein
MSQIINKNPKISDAQDPASMPFNPYPHKNHFARYILSVLVLVIVSFFAGIYLNKAGSCTPSDNQSIVMQASQSPQKIEIKKGSYDDGYQSALDFAKKKLEEQGLFKFNKNNLTNLVLKSVSGRAVTVQLDASQIDIFSEGLITKAITIPEDVKIEKHTLKSEAEIQKDFDEYKIQDAKLRKDFNSGAKIKDFPEPPATYIIENIKISDLQAGDMLNIVYVADATNPDILKATSVQLVNNPATVENVKDNPAKDAENNPAADVAPPPATGTEAPVKQ